MKDLYVVVGFDCNSDREFFLCYEHEEAEHCTVFNNLKGAEDLKTRLQTQFLEIYSYHVAKLSFLD